MKFYKNKMKNRLIAASSILLIIFFSIAKAEVILMSEDWASKACDAWNEDPILTESLVKSGWVNNDKDRGYKVMHIYRTDCPDSKKVEMRISLREGKAKCVSGGGVTIDKPDKKVDYVMHAKTKRWVEMGAGKYGPMKAMMFRRLKFKGPKGEAMGNMGPFKNFLLIAGSVPSDASNCP